MTEPLPVTAIWLRREGDKAIVLAEIGGDWIPLIEEHLEGNFSHIIEQAGIHTRYYKLPGVRL